MFEIGQRIRVLRGSEYFAAGAEGEVVGVPMDDAIDVLFDSDAVPHVVAPGNAELIG